MSKSSTSAAPPAAGKAAAPTSTPAVTASGSNGEGQTSSQATQRTSAADNSGGASPAGGRGGHPNARGRGGYESRGRGRGGSRGGRGRRSSGNSRVDSRGRGSDSRGRGYESRGRGRGGRGKPYNNSQDSGDGNNVQGNTPPPIQPQPPMMMAQGGVSSPHHQMQMPAMIPGQPPMMMGPNGPVMAPQHMTPQQIQYQQYLQQQYMQQHYLQQQHMAMAAAGMMPQGPPPMAPGGVPQPSGGQPQVQQPSRQGGSGPEQQSSTPQQATPGKETTPQSNTTTTNGVSTPVEVAPITYPITCPGHSRPVVDVEFSSPTPDGVFLVSGCHDKLPMLRWGDNGDWIGTFEGHKGAVWSATFNSDVSRVATASGDFSARIWDAVTGDLVHTFEHKHIVYAVKFSPQDDKLLTGGNEKKLRVFDLKAVHMPCAVTFETAAEIRKANWLSDELVICGCYNGVIQVWNTNEPSTPVSEWKTSNGAPVTDLEYCKPRETLTVSHGTLVSLYSSSDYSLVKSIDVGVEVSGATLNPVTGKYVVTGGPDLWVHVVDFDTGEKIKNFKGHHGPIFCVRYSPDGKICASGSEDGTIRLWDLEDKKVKTPVEEEETVTEE